MVFEENTEHGNRCDLMSFVVDFDVAWEVNNNNTYLVSVDSGIHCNGWVLCFLLSS